ncbi:hypothetical protein [Elizabethkingia sp. JS20170427COW]|uniref:hypothetical protein n=1 Tax=Elizabethkingia sp. JS20170427COW TaxID=2583851 RepID=UPI001110D6E0|nr:hypothetical protein [Elizabethkingia sp. JS20170427COW]QCX52568.1 hypothetical protein FGE20_01795 [Elizabethkingia sp. JS20170427COW]
MARKIYILLIIFIWGTYMYPGQMPIPQQQDIACCATPSDSGECCTMQGSTCHKDSKSSKQSCKDNCSTCHTCHSVFGFSAFTIPPTYKLTSYFSEIEISEYNFLSICTQIFNIWQPPKLS